MCPAREDRFETELIERRKDENYVSLGGLVSVFKDDLVHCCRALSPDNELCCGEPTMHVGVHRNGNTTWFENQWFCSKKDR